MIVFDFVPGQSSIFAMGWVRVPGCRSRNTCTPLHRSRCSIKKPGTAGNENFVYNFFLGKLPPTATGNHSRRLHQWVVFWPMHKPLKRHKNPPGTNGMTEKPTNPRTCCVPAFPPLSYRRGGGSHKPPPYRSRSLRACATRERKMAARKFNHAKMIMLTKRTKR